MAISEAAMGSPSMLPRRATNISQCPGIVAAMRAKKSRVRYGVLWWAA
jgi:hypothetical protein